jgi:hypothetical protein
VADLFNILRANYTAAGTVNYSRTPYVAVDPKLYEGTWSGKYSTNEAFNFQISSVNGFKAKVKYQSGSEMHYREVLIRDNAFKIGNSKFTLTRKGTAQVKTIVTNPANGASVLNTAYAKQA